MAFLRPYLTAFVALLGLFAAVKQAHAVSCVTQSQMTVSERAEYIRAMRALEAPIQAGNLNAVKAMTIAPVAAQFDGIAQSIQSLSPLIQQAVFTVSSMYLLKAEDLKQAEEMTEFFCSLPQSSLTVTVTIPQLPPGVYLLALLHATGVEHPQQVSMILQKEGAEWKLAGFFARPMSLGNKEGVWYWVQAREYAKKHQNWNAWFYYQTAAFLLNPVDFLSSPNLEKLHREAQEVRPEELPAQSQPLKVTVNNQSLEITHLRTDDFNGNLDLVVTYQAKDISDPAATRTQIVALMKALLSAHPELRQAFHGLWVYATAENRPPYAIELPMEQIQ